MHQIGDVVDGFCPRCRLNTYQIVSATDGREVFSATCRTCRNTIPYKPEVSIDELREKQIKKLKTLVRKKSKDMMTPSIIHLASRKNRDAGDLDMPLRAFREMHGRDPDATPPPSVPAAMAEAVAHRNTPVAPVASSGATGATARWQRLTERLSARDGRPYVPTRTYKVGDVLLHKTHGLGIVEQVVHEQAVMVLFRDVETVLEMAAPPALDGPRGGPQAKLIKGTPGG